MVTCSFVYAFAVLFAGNHAPHAVKLVFPLPYLAHRHSPLDLSSCRMPLLCGLGQLSQCGVSPVHFSCLVVQAERTGLNDWADLIATILRCTTPIY
jgi:hypothetical protein